MPPASSMRSRERAARQVLLQRPGEDRLELRDGRIVAHAVERQPDDRLHRRAKLDLEALRLDQLEIFLGLVLGIEREVVGGAEALVERRVAAHLRLPGLFGQARGHLSNLLCMDPSNSYAGSGVVFSTAVSSTKASAGSSGPDWTTFP